jgi:hypothetical protein
MTPVSDMRWLAGFGTCSKEIWYLSGNHYNRHVLTDRDYDQHFEHNKLLVPEASTGA